MPSKLYGYLISIQEEVTWGEETLVWQRIDPEGEGRHISTLIVLSAIT